MRRKRHRRRDATEENERRRYDALLEEAEFAFQYGDITKAQALLAEVVKHAPPRAEVSPIEEEGEPE